MLMYENFISSITNRVNDRSKLADAIISITTELFPKIKIKKIYSNGKIYINVNGDRTLVLIGSKQHEYPSEFGGSETIININNCFRTFYT